MRSVSSRPPVVPAVAAATASSKPAPRGTNTTPGFVQNCPTPSVNDPASPVASAAPRAATAARVSTTGLTLPSSP